MNTYATPEARDELDGDIAQKRKPGRPAKVRAALDDLDVLLSEFIHFPDERQRWACVLWVGITYSIDVRHGDDFVFDVAPYLWVKSAGRNSGKTTLAYTLAWAARNGKHSSSMTASAFYRQAEPVTPFFDEADNIFRAGKSDDPETATLLAVINGGTTREGSVERTNRGLGVDSFRTFGPKAIIGISVPIPDTTASRCIHVELVRALPGEVPRKFRRRSVKPRATAVAAVLDAEALSLPIPVPDDEGFDELGFIQNRDYDVWESMYALAERIDGAWPERCIEAAKYLTKPEQTMSSSEQLLADVVALFDEIGGEFIPSIDILGDTGDTYPYTGPASGLLGMTESPWATWRRTKPMTLRDMAKMLKPYGIEPDYQEQAGKRGRRGYFRSDVQEAADRNLPAVLAVDEKTRNEQDRGTSASPRHDVEEDVCVRDTQTPTAAPVSAPNAHGPHLSTASTATTASACECGAPMVDFPGEPSWCGDAKRHAHWLSRAASTDAPSMELLA